MKFHVFVAAGADDDIRQILNWIRERSATGALTWWQRWQEVLASLNEQADIYGVAPESEDHPQTIHQVIFKTRRGRPYRALFVVESQNAYILHVRGPGQSLLDPDEVRPPK